ncbi:MAG: haloacid dehalogenase type II [Cyclobacteriaceae bacterium]
MTNRPEVLLFDVNETLLDLEPVKSSVSQVLGNRPELVPLWFTTLLQYALVTTVSDHYADFGSIGVAALQMVAEKKGLPLSREQAQEALRPMLSLAPHPEVKEALATLQKVGYRLAALTNSSRKAMEAQLANAGINVFFEQMLSVDDIGMYKPHQHVYRWAAGRMQAAPAECMMIAAHGWDVAGAKWAGMRTAFIGRPGQMQFSLAPAADLVFSDMRELAEELCR